MFRSKYGRREKLFFIENAFPGFSLGNPQNIGVLETCGFSRPSAKMGGA
jgi:hypothetical protein